MKLEIFLYCNQFQLGNEDILYSDGKRYKPALIAINELKAFLPSVKNVLVLGTGLGSMVQIVRSKGFDPAFTLVENNDLILLWAMEFMEGDDNSNINPVCSDAKMFMDSNTMKFDFLFIDIFQGRVVPDFVTTTDFLSKCRDSLTAGGRLAFNYILNDKQQWEQDRKSFSTIFPNHKIIEHEINRIFITG